MVEVVVVVVVVVVTMLLVIVIIHLTPPASAAEPCLTPTTSGYPIAPAFSINPTPNKSPHSPTVNSSPVTCLRTWL